MRLGASRLWILALYVLMVGGAVLLFLLIRAQGEQLAPPGVGPAAGAAAGGTAQLNTLLHVLLALATIVVVARIMGAVARALHQPAVIGEVVGGILLGPSLLGRVAPDALAFLLPQSVAPILGVIAQLGVILYMFLVGLELDLRVVRSSGPVTLAISHASITLPFLLGAGLALGIYTSVSRPDVSFTSFALFLGVSMSVTAFPVLARILTDQGVHRTHMGSIALTCAAVDDVTAWCLLALVVSVSQARPEGAVLTVALTIGYVAAMLLIARPLVGRLTSTLERQERLPEGGLAIIFVAILLSALATELIGIHAIFGAFLLGAIMPPWSRLAAELTHRLRDLVQVMFLPVFFAYTGLRTQMGLLSTADDWLLCGLIVFVATVGKFGGTLIAGRLTGLGWRDASALGALMNTRGLVELIVLNIGLDLGIISPSLFTMLVIMAVTTTLMTTPVFRLITRRQPWTERPPTSIASLAGSRTSTP